MSTARKVMLALGIIGIVALAIGAIVYNYERDFALKGKLTEGVVIDFIAKESKDDDGRRKLYYYPVIRFDAGQADSVSWTANSGSRPPSYEVGEKVEILYDPHDTEHVRMNSFFSLYIGTFVCILVGSIFSLISITLLFSTRNT